MAHDEDRLQEFMARFAADQGATMHAATVVIGDQLGLYRALGEGGPKTADELAAAAGCQPRLVPSGSVPRWRARTASTIRRVAGTG